MRRFNVTGACVGHKHYMVNISGKLDQIEKLVDDEHYFTINRARQYGKTTTLLHLKKRLDACSDYICASITFEDVGINAFDSEEAFCRMFLGRISDALVFSNAEDEYAIKWRNLEFFDFESLRKHITKMCNGRKVVLMIDEVDKSSDNRLFLHFLGMLRAKYLLRQASMDHTFHTVILAGVTDIKNLKLKMINDGIHKPVKEECRIINSPWNIAATFNVDMSFGAEEISAMLDEYESDNKTGMDISAVANEIHKHTNGYPFLVSRICQCIDEELDRNWSASGVNHAVQIVINEKNVLFDDMAKNLENNKNLYNFLYELLVLGVYKSYNHDNPVVSLASTFGYIIRADGKNKAIVSNRIFESRMMHYFASKDEASPCKIRMPGAIYQDVIKGNSFDMAACLLKFAEHYREISALRDARFLERHGRLLFLSFLAPLLNGQGFFHIESQFTDVRRMFIVVDFEKEQHIVELKLWKGEAAKEHAYEQLLGYMESKNARQGYLLTFDFRKAKTGEHRPGWVDVGGKRIFDIVV